MDTKIKNAVEKFNQLISAECENEDFGIPTSIDTPVVWGRTATGIKVQDLKEEHFEDVIDIIRVDFISTDSQRVRHVSWQTPIDNLLSHWQIRNGARASESYYVQDEALYKSTKLVYDRTSYDSYLIRLIFHLYGMTSLVAIDENWHDEYDYLREKPLGARIVGVLVTRIVRKIDYGRIFSRTQLVEGTAMKKCTGLRAYLSKKVDLFAKFNCDSFLRYYDFCILPEYEESGLDLLMLKCGISLARSLRAPLVMGLFSNAALQELVKKLGMQVLLEVKYSEWKDTGGEIIFNNPGKENHTCALMAGLVPPNPALTGRSVKSPVEVQAKSGSPDKGKKKGK